MQGQFTIRGQSLVPEAEGERQGQTLEEGPWKEKGMTGSENSVA